MDDVDDVDVVGPPVLEVDDKVDGGTGGNGFVNGLRFPRRFCRFGGFSLRFAPAPDMAPEPPAVASAVAILDPPVMDPVSDPVERL